MIALIKRMVRVVVGGGIATAVDTVVLIALYRGFGISAGIATLCGCLVGGAVNFVLNRRWVFGASGGWLKQALLYIAIVVAGGAVISGIAVAALHAVGFPLLLAKLGSIGVVLIAWTYPMSARVVFAPAR